MTGRSGSGRHGIPAIAGTIALAFRAWRHRRVVGRLGALDDRLLADIGLTRGEVLGVLAEPLLSDPSEVLARTVQGKRAARSASAREALAFAAERHVEPPRRAA